MLKNWELDARKVNCLPLISEDWYLDAVLLQIVGLWVETVHLNERGLFILQASIIVTDSEVDEIESDEADCDYWDNRTEVRGVRGAVLVVHAHLMSENVKTFQVCQVFTRTEFHSDQIIICNVFNK